jgi:probable HAF family extracellular repeat protein
VRAHRLAALAVAVTVVGASFSVAAAPVAAAQPAYDIVPVPSLPGGRETGVTLTTGGRMTGQVDLGPNKQHAFYFDGSTMIDLGTLGGSHSNGIDINRSGDVVGTAELANGDTHAFVWRSGVMTDLGTLGGTYSGASFINDAGQIAGIATLANGESHAVLWDGGSVTDLGTLGGNQSSALGITSAGVVVGYSFASDGNLHSFWYDGVMHDVGTVDGLAGMSGFVYTIVTGVTDGGLMYGYVQDPSSNDCPWFGGSMTSCERGFTAQVGGAIQLIGSLSANPDFVALPAGANDSGRVVGTSLTDEDPLCTDGVDHFPCQRGFVDDDGQMTALPVIGPDANKHYSGGGAFSVNASGDFLGASVGVYFLDDDNVIYLLTDLAPNLFPTSGYYPAALSDDGVIATISSDGQLALLVPHGLDFTAPAVDLSSPADGALYTLGQSASASYSCDDGIGTGVASCAGDLPSGAALDLSHAGHFTFNVTATDVAGNTRTVSHAYDVTAGDVTTTVNGNDSGPVTVTTDPAGVGPSAQVPIQTSVQFSLPSAEQANVSIDLHAPDVTPPPGYALLGYQVDINLGGVPDGGAIVISFLLDPSTGADPSTITIGRNANGVTDVLAPCVTEFNPNPCFTAAYVAGPGSAVELTAYTTHASKWIPIVPQATPPVVTIDSVSRPVIGASGSSTVTWRSNENGSFSVRGGGTDCSTGTQLASGTYTTAPSAALTPIAASALALGSNTVRVCVTDAGLLTGSATTTIVKDTTAPTVSSIALAGTTPTNVPSVSWKVTFSEPVTGVGAGNFTLVRVGSGGSPAITGVTGTGAVWNVTATSGSGDWALQLDLTSRAGIVDLAGNVLSNTLVGKIYQIDRVAPTITLTKPASGAVYALGSTVNASFSCSDERLGTGIASCTGTKANGAHIDTASIGSKTFTVVALDRAGNSTTSTATYSVIYPFSGFLGSVSNPPTLNSAKAGSGVGLVFSLGGNRGSAIFAGSPVSQPINCSTHATSGSPSATTGALAYNANAGRYTYTWQSNSAWVNTCRQITITLADGTTHRAFFKFTK